MVQILKDKIDNIITIIILFFAITGSSLFDNSLLFLLYTCIIYILLLIVYEYIKYKFFGEHVIGDVDWLFSTKKRHWIRHLPVQEASVSSRSVIYIVTDNLDLDTNHPETIKLVSDNLKKGVEYIFITSNADLYRNKIDRLRELHARSDGLSIVTISDATIRERTLDNMMIISDPENGGASAYMQLPIGGEEWWVKLDEEHTDQAYGNVNSFLRDSTSQVEHGFDPLVKYGKNIGRRT